MLIFFSYSTLFDISLFFCLFKKAPVRSDPLVECDSEGRVLPD